MYSQTILIGYVGSEPKVVDVGNDRKLASFSLATSVKYKSQGEMRDDTTWHRINVLNSHIASVVERFVHKGSLVQVVGRIQKREYEDREGVTQQSFEIVIPPYDGGLTLLPSRTNPPADQTSPNTVAAGIDDEFDDEIPF